MNYWLFKSEPETYSFDRLKREGRTEWSGVRNFQARNNMKEMKAGDLGFFYHSSIPEPGIAGIVKVSREAYPDFTARQRGGPYFDPKCGRRQSDLGDGRRRLRARLAALCLSGRTARQPGARRDDDLAPARVELSVQPVHVREWNIILAMAERLRA